MQRVNSIKNARVRGKRVLIRVDFNVSLNSDFSIADDTRIKEVLPTIKFLKNQGAKVILASHLGRPNGKVEKKYSLRKVAKRLSELLGQKVLFWQEITSKKTLLKIKKLKKGEVVLLENVRFYEGETLNDPQFAKILSLFGNIFVNEAFGTAHRAHASTVGVTNFLPSYAGFLMEKEINILSSVIKNPKRPLLVIIGGAKTPEKIAVILKLLNAANAILLGGAVANTFFCTWGIGTGCSLVNREMIEAARACFWKATRTPTVLLLPTDVVVANPEKKAETKVVNYKRVSKNYAIYDIGPKTQRLYAKYIKKAGTIIWNGPMGVYEKKKFAQGTNYLLKKVSQSSAFSILGGGDTLSAIKEKELVKGFSHLSTGGGAMVEFLEKGTLPAIEALRQI